MVRKLLLLTLVLAMLPASAFAQDKFQITGFGGYQFGGKIYTSVGELDPKDNWMWGLSIEIPMPVKPGSYLLLWYSQQPTTMRLKDYLGTRELFDVNINYFQIGGLYEVDRGTNVVPFTTLTLGATWFDPGPANDPTPTYGQPHSVTKFSFVFGGGVKVWMNPKLALRIQGQLFSTIFAAGGGFYVGGGGSGMSITGTGMLQGAVSAGLTLGLGGDS